MGKWRGGRGGGGKGEIGRGDQRGRAIRGRDGKERVEKGGIKKNLDEGICLSCVYCRLGKEEGGVRRKKVR